MPFAPLINRLKYWYEIFQEDKWDAVSRVIDRWLPILDPRYYFPARTILSIYSLYFLLGKAIENGWLELGTEQTEKVVSFINSQLSTYSAITIGFFWALFSAYVWSIANDKGIKFRSVYERTPYKEVLWWRIWYFIFTALTFSGVFRIADAPLLSYIDSNRLLLAMAAFFMLDIAWFFYDVFRTLGILEDPGSWLLIYQNEEYLKWYYKEIHKEVARNAFEFEKNIDWESLSTQTWGYSDKHFYKEKIIEFVESITRNGNISSYRHIKDVKSILNRLRTYFDVAYYREYGYEPNEKSVFQNGNALIYWQIVLYVCLSLLERNKKVALILFKDNAEFFSSILFREDYNKKTKDSLIEFFLENYEFSKILILDTYRISDRLRHASFFEGKFMPPWISSLTGKHIDSLIDDPDVEAGKAMGFLFDLWACYWKENATWMFSVFEQFFRFTVSPKGRTASFSGSLHNLSSSLSHQERIEHNIEDIFEHIITPLFTWIFDENRINANKSEPLHILRKNFYEGLSSIDNLRFHKILCKKLITNFDTDMKVTDKWSLDLVIAGIINHLDPCFPELSNKEIIKEFYNKVKIHTATNWYSFPEVSFIDEISLEKQTEQLRVIWTKDLQV